MLIAFEPFLQLLVSFNDDFQVKHGDWQSNISLCNTLDVGIYNIKEPESPVSMLIQPSNESITLWKYDFQSDEGISSAFRSGFYIRSSTDLLPTPKFFCSTLNCTWETSPTIAICSECADITRALTRYETRYEDGRHSLTNALPFINITNWHNSNGSNNNWVQMTATRITDSQRTISFKHLTTMITTLQVIKASDEYEDSYFLSAPTVKATECALYFCVKALESTVEDGILRERVVASWHGRDMSSYLKQPPDDEDRGFSSFEAWSNHSLYSLSGDVIRDDLRFQINRDDRKLYNMDDEQYPMSITQNTIGSVLHLVNDEILGENMVWPHGNPAAILQALHERGNLTGVFDNVARLVSNWIRDFHGSEKMGSEQKRIIVQIKWPFSILPALTISLGYMFSIWTMLETRQLSLRPWKTDMVETLAHCADVETGMQLMRANRNGNLRNVARGMKVRLENTKRGLELRVKRDSKR